MTDKLKLSNSFMEAIAKVIKHLVVSHSLATREISSELVSFLLKLLSKGYSQSSCMYALGWIVEYYSDYLPMKQVLVRSIIEISSKLQTKLLSPASHDELSIVSDYLNLSITYVSSLPDLFGVAHESHEENSTIFSLIKLMMESSIASFKDSSPWFLLNSILGLWDRFTLYQYPPSVPLGCLLREYHAQMISKLFHLLLIGLPSLSSRKQSNSSEEDTNAEEDNSDDRDSYHEIERISLILASLYQTQPNETTQEIKKFFNALVQPQTMLSTPSEVSSFYSTLEQSLPKNAIDNVTECLLLFSKGVSRRYKSKILCPPPQ